METSELLNQFRDADGNPRLEFIPNVLLCGDSGKDNVDLQIFHAMDNCGGNDGQL